MNLLWATLIHLFIAALLGAGIIMLMHGKPALLIVGGLVYTLVFAKVGCASH